jgi:hypothetical protein
MAKVIGRCLFDSGEIHEFQHEERKTLKEKSAHDMGPELVAIGWSYSAGRLHLNLR